jgi:soluble lytic murein transglycosylase-like protein
MNNMRAVMNRINEIRGKFGLRSGQISQRERHSRNSIDYQDYHAKAIEERGADKGQGPKADKSTGRQGSVEEIKKIADHYAAAKKVPAGLVKAVIEAESGYNARAVSPKGAKGLMQLMPATIRNMGVNDPYDPYENIGAGTDLLKTLLQNYNWDYKKALAAYNAGEKAVDSKGGVPDYNETRDFVKKVINAYMRNSE